MNGFCSEGPSHFNRGFIHSKNTHLPTYYDNLLVWWALPQKSLIASPNDYVSLIKPIVSASGNLLDPTWKTINVSKIDATTISDTLDSAVTSHGILNSSISIVSMNQHTRFTIEVGSGTLHYCQISFDSFSNYIHLDTDAGAIITSVGGTWTVKPGNLGWIVTIDVPKLIHNANFRIYMGIDPTTYTYVGTGTGTIKIYNVSIQQDGVIQTLKDRKVLMLGSQYFGKTAYDATQTSLADMPYYQGELSTTWSTGAPCMYNPAHRTSMGLNIPSSLASQLGGDVCVIMLIKFFAKPTANAIIPFLVTGPRAQWSLKLPSNGIWRSTHRNDIGNIKVSDWEHISTAEEIVSIETWESATTTSRQMFGLLVAEDYASPSITGITPPFTFTGGKILTAYVADTSLRHAIREIAIFKTIPSITAIRAVAAGMLARAML